jgi:hypothetical protein
MFTLLHYTNNVTQGFHCEPEKAVEEAGRKVIGYQYYPNEYPIKRVENIGIETSRTTAGDKLWRAGVTDFAELQRRVKVDIRNIRIWEDNNGATGEVWTSTDGQPFVNEGDYVLSCKVVRVEPEMVLL